MPDTNECVILAADDLDLQQTLALVRKVGNEVCGVKIHDLWDRHGPSVVRMLLEAGAPCVWVDLKLHDIPQTVRNRAKAVAGAGAQMLSVHASGGVQMMQAAKDSGIEIIAITVLTSLDEAQTQRIFRRTPEVTAFTLALQAHEAGVRTVVCSPGELQVLANHTSLSGMNFITPGVRSPGVDTNDQKRVDTPAAALAHGATRLVIGRQIIRAEDPLAALAAIQKEINP